LRIDAKVLLLLTEFGPMTARQLYDEGVCADLGKVSSIVRRLEEKRQIECCGYAAPRKFGRANLWRIKS
jgi:hypothetical protein